MEQPPSGSLTKSTFSSGQNRKVNKKFKPASKTGGSIPLPYLPKICLRHLIISAKLPKCVYIQFPVPLKTSLSQGYLYPRGFRGADSPLPAAGATPVSGSLPTPTNAGSRCRTRCSSLSPRALRRGARCGVRDAGCEPPRSPHRPDRRSVRSDGSERPPKPVRPSRADHPSRLCADGPPARPDHRACAAAVLSPRSRSSGTGLPPAPGERGVGGGRKRREAGQVSEKRRAAVATPARPARSQPFSEVLKAPPASAAAPPPPPSSSSSSPSLPPSPVRQAPPAAPARSRPPPPLRCGRGGGKGGETPVIDRHPCGPIRSCDQAGRT